MESVLFAPLDHGSHWLKPKQPETSGSLVSTKPRYTYVCSKLTSGSSALVSIIVGTRESQEPRFWLWEWIGGELSFGGI